MIKGEEGGMAPVLLFLTLRIPEEEEAGDEDKEDDEFEGATLFDSFVVIACLSSILWCITLVELKLTGRTQLQNNPAKCEESNCHGINEQIEIINQKKNI